MAKGRRRPFLPLLIAVPVVSAATDWASISPLLPAFAAELPTTPSKAAAQALFQGVVLGGGAPFASFTIHAHDDDSATTLSNAAMRVQMDQVVCGGNVDGSALVAGPSYLCTSADSCAGPDCLCRGVALGTERCRATINQGSVQLLSKVGSSGYAPQSASPSFIQHTFPALPAGASSISLRFDIDQRYRPQLYGGNPCPSASATHNCSLCVSGPWDYGMPAGVHVLWSAAGREDYVISAPLTDLQERYDRAQSSGDSAELSLVLDAPAELALSPGDLPVVTFLVFNQYLGYQSVTRSDSGHCRPDQSTPDSYPLADRNTAFFLKSATLLYRQSLELPTEPAVGRPRLYGADAAWESDRVVPFLDVACEPTAEQNLGYFGKAGVWDAKGYWEKAALDYTTCDGGTGTVTPYNDLSENAAAARYLDTTDSNDTPRFRDGRRCLFLLRRLWICATRNGGSYDTCEHSEAQADLLSRAVVASDLHSFYTTPSGYKVSAASPVRALRSSARTLAVIFFSPAQCQPGALRYPHAAASTAWRAFRRPLALPCVRSQVSFECGANPTNEGSCKFDLNTQEQVSYFSLWYDVFSSRPGHVDTANLTAVASALKSRIRLFVTQFESGDWRLWNGNNWTPRLCVGALHWAIAFWHEEPSLARSVLGMINDLLWLHYPVFYLPDGTPVEGISYSYMSVEDAVELSEMQVPSPNEPQ